MSLIGVIKVLSSKVRSMLRFHVEGAQTVVQSLTFYSNVRVWGLKLVEIGLGVSLIGLPSSSYCLLDLMSLWWEVYRT